MAEIKGLKELSRKLSALGAAVGGKTLRSAAMSAALPALRAAQARAPISDRDYLKKTYKGRYVAPGFLKRNIASKSILYRDKRTVKILIGPKPEAFYGTQFIEIGTSTIPKSPWLEPAFRSQQAVMVQQLSARLKQLIEKAANK